MNLPVLPWYSAGLNFTCTACGNCCTGGPGYVWISEEEIHRLARHLHLTPQQTIDQYCRRIGDRYSLNEHRNPQGQYDCVFLKEIPAEPAAPNQIAHPKRVCGIYAVRPLQCRTWPFWDGLLQSKQDWSRAARRCPGMNHGQHYSQAQIDALRTAQDWPTNPPTSK